MYMSTGVRIARGVNGDRHEENEKRKKDKKWKKKIMNEKNKLE
jgi:hypothetical protein